MSRPAPDALRWTCKACGAQIDLPRLQKQPQIPGQRESLPEWKWHKGWLEHRCRGRYTRCRVKAPSPRYIVLPGYVTSWNDHQRHFVSADRLMDLYGVRRCECIVVDPLSVGDSRIDQKIKDEGLIPLMPRGDGNYKLKTALQRTLEL